MNRCLAYARAIEKDFTPVFFSLAAAIETIEEIGYEADYFISPYWADTSSYIWNCELAIRFGMLLELVNPSVVVFDGTWPFEGFLSALISYGKRPKVVWSKRGLVRNERADLQATEALFDLIIEPGEVGTEAKENSLNAVPPKILLTPVCLLHNDEILDRCNARKALGLDVASRQVLFSLGSGNLKDVSAVGAGLVHEFHNAGFKVSWTVPSISTKDPELPEGVKLLELYPLAKYLRAFDYIVAAAGYNTCCEIVQTGVPSLLIPNEQVVDDQKLRAIRTAKYVPCVVSSCENKEERKVVVKALLKLFDVPNEFLPPSMNGAELAAKAILNLARDGKS